MFVLHCYAYPRREFFSAKAYSCEIANNPVSLNLEKEYLLLISYDTLILINNDFLRYYDFCWYSSIIRKRKPKTTVLFIRSKFDVFNYHLREKCVKIADTVNYWKHVFSFEEYLSPEDNQINRAITTFLPWIYSFLGNWMLFMCR